MGKDRSLNRLQAMVDRAPIAIICFDKGLRITEWNQAAARQLGVMASEAKGRLVSEFFSEETGAGPKQWQALSEAHGTVDLLGRAIAQSGDFFSVRLVASELELSGQAETMLCFTRDLPERQLESESLRRTDEVKQRADLLNALADGEIASREVAIQRGKALGLDLAAKYALFAISIDDYAGNPMLNCKRTKGECRKFCGR